MSLTKTYNVPKIKLSAKATDHTGKRLGKLTVMHPTRSDGVHLLWAAECTCGTKVEVRASQITASAVDSCGRCQILPYVTLRELPYQINGEVDAQVQKDLPLEDPSVAEIIESVDLDTLPNSVEAKYGAWDAAIRCCKILGVLNSAELKKARQLIDVQLGDI